MKLDSVFLLCDIDGVLADFVGEFQLYMRLAYGQTLPIAHLNTFDLDRCIEGFLSDAKPEAAAAFIERFSPTHVLGQIFMNPYFYWHLKPYFEVKDALELHTGPLVYITNRDAALGRVTAEWLRAWGVRTYPYSGLKTAFKGEPYARDVDQKRGVVYTKHKDLLIAQTLADYPDRRAVFIEDNPANVEAVASACASAGVASRIRIVLIDQPYNRAPVAPPVMRWTREQLLERMTDERRLFDSGADTTL